MTPERRHELYWLGYRAGVRLAEHKPEIYNEAGLRLNLIFAGNGRGRPFALGELRGYRHALGLPIRVRL
jgi:hypothetical protein